LHTLAIAGAINNEITLTVEELKKCPFALKTKLKFKITKTSTL
jgi:hypothetical protein